MSDQFDHDKTALCVEHKESGARLPTYSRAGAALPDSAIPESMPGSSAIVEQEFPKG
jgi:hypothetical protein